MTKSVETIPDMFDLSCTEQDIVNKQMFWGVVRARVSLKMPLFWVHILRATSQEIGRKRQRRKKCTAICASVSQRPPLNQCAILSQLSAPKHGKKEVISLQQ